MPTVVKQTYLPIQTVFGYEWMGQDLFWSNPFLLVHLEHVLQKLHTSLPVFCLEAGFVVCA